MQEEGEAVVICSMRGIRQSVCHDSVAHYRICLCLDDFLKSHENFHLSCSRVGRISVKDSGNQVCMNVLWMWSNSALILIKK